MDYKNLIFDKVSKFGGEDIFIEEARKIWLRDPENVSKIYTRDKGSSNYKVVSLKTGGYALVNGNKDIVFKNEDLHLCKVEWVMLVYYNIKIKDKNGF